MKAIGYGYGPGKEPSVMVHPGCRENYVQTLKPIGSTMISAVEQGYTFPPHLRICPVCRKGFEAVVATTHE